MFPSIPKPRLNSPRLTAYWPRRRTDLNGVNWHAASLPVIINSSSTIFPSSTGKRVIICLCHHTIQKIAESLHILHCRVIQKRKLTCSIHTAVHVFKIHFWSMQALQFLYIQKPAQNHTSSSHASSHVNIITKLKKSIALLWMFCHCPILKHKLHMLRNQSPAQSSTKALHDYT